MVPKTQISTVSSYLDEQESDGGESEAMIPNPGPTGVEVAAELFCTAELAIPSADNWRRVDEPLVVVFGVEVVL